MLAADAFARFDRGDTARAEASWSQVRQREDGAHTAYTEAARALESAFLLATDRASVRRTLGEVTLERILVADRDFHVGERAELVGRLSLYDVDHELAARLPTPPRIEPVAPPPGVEVPGGFVYIPAGIALYGSRDDDGTRQWFGTVPMHQVATRPYLIARTEITYRQWIEFLDALPPVERVTRTPGIKRSLTADGEQLVELRPVGPSWELRLQPLTVTYVARAGSPIEYRDRTRRKRQDWLDFPVSAVSADDVVAYAAWVDHTRRVPRARLCTEQEWERAARGVDGRSFPHGEHLEPDDANIDATYGHLDGGFGPDAVGSHPASRSVYGLDDMSGNVWEITVSSDKTYVTRGGCFFTGPRTAHLANRSPVARSNRHLLVGARLCADPS
jgi:formylglycine-generating enzyme required for sulfatase activity